MIRQLLTLLFFALTSIGTAADTLQFKASVMRLEAPVILADIVEVTENSALAHLTVPAELKHWVTQERINQWLIDSGHLKKIPNWRGLQKVWLDWCFPFKTDTLEDALSLQLPQSVFNASITMQSLDIRNSNRAQLCFDESVKSFSIDSIDIVNGNHARANVSFSLMGGKQLKQQLQLEYQAQVVGLKSNRDLAKGSALKFEYFIPTEMRWTGKEVSDKNVLRRMKLSRTLTRNSTLNTHHMDPIELVEMGQLVKVKLQHGTIKIETKGRAIESGNQGDLIPVRIEGSGSLSQAIVLAKGVVSVSV